MGLTVRGAMEAKDARGTAVMAGAHAAEGRIKVRRVARAMFMVLKGELRGCGEGNWGFACSTSPKLVIWVCFSFLWVCFSFLVLRRCLPQA